MRTVVTAVIGTVLLVPALSSARPKPSGKGYIILDSNCDVQATNLDITVDPHTTSAIVKWVVFNDGCPRAKLAVGIFQSKADLQYYPLLDCKGISVGSNKTRFQCKLNLACPLPDDSVYNYGVCVNGESVWDPELRIKGGTPLHHLGTCPGDSDKTAAKTACEAASQ
jgi:hypothetical protein